MPRQITKLTLALAVGILGLVTTSSILAKAQLSIAALESDIAVVPASKAPSGHSGAAGTASSSNNNAARGDDASEESEESEESEKSEDSEEDDEDDELFEEDLFESDDDDF